MYVESKRINHQREISLKGFYDNRIKTKFPPKNVRLPVSSSIYVNMAWKYDLIGKDYTLIYKVYKVFLCYPLLKFSPKFKSEKYVLWYFKTGFKDDFHSTLHVTVNVIPNLSWISITLSNIFFDFYRYKVESPTL